MLSTFDDSTVLRSRLKTIRSRRLKDNHKYPSDGFALLHPEQERQFAEDSASLLNTREIVRDTWSKRPVQERTRV